MLRLTRRRLLLISVVLLTTGDPSAAVAQGRGSLPLAVDETRLAVALREAVAGAIDVPESEPDGTPRDGRSAAPWLRLPAASADDAAVTIVANPLNPEQRARALQAEREIQQAARASQEAAQRDYDRAVDAFARGVPTPDRLREISLDDEGVAGERYDAESELIVRATWQQGRQVLTRSGPVPPDVVPSDGRPWVMIAAAAGEYGSPARYAPTELWVAVGVSAVPAVRGLSATSFEIALGETGGGPWVLVHARGPRTLIESLLAVAPWMPVVRLLPGR
jgi:hypothetical protein